MADLTPGSRLGPYEIVSRIGAGGMGEVFRARDTRLERNVAVKILPAEFAGNASLRLRFEREARAISQLNHPHICTLHDVGSDGGVEFLVMELIEGETLADRIARGPLPLADVLKFGAQIADGLDAAHRAGIVHRDLKPGNIMLTRAGAKLLDFGLARTNAAPSSSASAPIDETAAHESRTAFKPLTAEGTIVGTFQYMAPEQLAGEEADARTDLFALGCVLYEMLTGRRAFQGKTRTSLIAAIVGSEPAPLSSLVPFTPAALEHVVRRCLAKERDDRWQSAHDVAAELRWIGETASHPAAVAPEAPRRRNRERLFWIAVLAAAIAATAALAPRLRRQPAAPTYHFTIPARGDGFTFASWPLLSPDGRAVVFVGRKADDTYVLAMRRLDRFSVTPLLKVEPPFNEAFWSADSRSVAVRQRGKLWRIDVDGGQPQSIADVPSGGRDGAWAPDGTILLGYLEGPLQRSSTRGETPVAITKLDPAKHERGHHAPFFLPDGKTFLFVTFSRDPSRPDMPHTLYAGRLGEPEIRRVADVTSKVRYAAGHLFHVRGGSLLAVPFDAGKLTITGEPAVIAEDVGYFFPTAAASFSVSDDGTVAWTPRARPNRLFITDGAGATLREIAANEDFTEAVSATADGAHVVVARRDRAFGTHDLWMYGIDRPTATRLTFDSLDESSPVVSADGARVYYGSDRKGVPDLYVKHVGGGEADQVLVEEPGDQRWADVARDGSYVLYLTSSRETSSDIHALSLRDRKRLMVAGTPARERHPRLSPDGAAVAFQSDTSGRDEIYLKPFLRAGLPRQVSFGGGQYPKWSGDGRTLFFLSGDRTIMRASIAGDTVGDPQVVFQHAREIEAYEPLPNGRFLLLDVDEEAEALPGNVIVRWPETSAARR
jgi:Tol biopolymer transport system component